MALKKYDLNCRVCLNYNENGFCMFSCDLVENISAKIQNYSGITIKKGDGFPSSICSICIEELKVVQHFVDKCQKSDQQLHQAAATLKHEFIPFSKNSNHSLQKESIGAMSENENDLYTGEENTTSDENITKILFKKKKIKQKDKFKSKKLLENKNNLIKKYCGPCTCSSCGLQLRSRSALEIHWRVHSGERPHTCPACPMRFSQKSSLRIHLERKHISRSAFSQAQERRFTCETCGKRFSSSSNLKIHYRIHSGELPYKCSECGRSFAQLGSLTAHQRRHSGQRPYACDLCAKTFVELTHLKRHRSVHSQDRPFICSICGKGVKSPFALKQHMKLHSNKKEHVCEKCGAAFVIKGNLDAHIRVVHSEKSGQCLICRKICSNLVEHMTEHTGDKPHRCEICDKQFSRKRGLIVHSRQHTAAGKFECNIPGCGRSFYAQWVLDCHILKHTGNTPFVCKFCMKGFFRVCHLTKHLKLNHPNAEKKNGT